MLLCVDRFDDAGMLRTRGRRLAGVHCVFELIFVFVLACICVCVFTCVGMCVCARACVGARVRACV